MFRRSFLSVSVLAALSLSSGLAVAATDMQAASLYSPTDVVSRVDATILKSLRLPSQTPWATRVAVWNPVIAQTFHIQRVAQLTLGSDLSRLSPAQQSVFRQDLLRYTVASYAHNFRNGSVHLTITGHESLQPGTVAVFTRLVTKSGKTHTLDYLLQDLHHRWGIVNVIADGVSNLAITKAEYMGLYRTGGFAALNARITHKTVTLEQDTK